MNSDAPSSTPTPARTIEALIRLIETLCAILGCWSGTGASNARQLARSVQTLRDLADQVRAIHADRMAAAAANPPETFARIPSKITPLRPCARLRRTRHHERSDLIYLSAGGLLIAGNSATRAIHSTARAPP
ncbi:MAG TPA: hypothetical protein VF286_13805 [Acidiphilium sp.]